MKKQTKEAADKLNELRKLVSNIINISVELTEIARELEIEGSKFAGSTTDLVHELDDVTTKLGKVISNLEKE